MDIDVAKAVVESDESNAVERLVTMFQCPGCMCGSDTKCGTYKYVNREQRCVSHTLGTMINLGNIIALGLPMGFNKPGLDQNGAARNKMDIRLWPKGTHPHWNHLNIPVWAMEEDGFLFVRTYAPRVNFAWVDVIENGTLLMVPEAINVANFINTID